MRRSSTATATPIARQVGCRRRGHRRSRATSPSSASSATTASPIPARSRRMPAAIGNLDCRIPKQELRRNRGFEAVDDRARRTPLDGARVGVTEKSLDRNGNIFAAFRRGRARASSRSSATTTSTSPTATSCPMATCFCWSGIFAGRRHRDAAARSSTPPRSARDAGRRAGAARRRHGRPDRQYGRAGRSGQRADGTHACCPWCPTTTTRSCSATSAWSSGWSAKR